MRRFAGLRLTGPLPDETTILNFRHLLERHGLGRGLFEEINAHLAERGYRVRAGTIVDASIIAAPSSTKNREGARDPEMHQTRKGNEWHFGMKAHIGVDAETGLVHGVRATPANTHDLREAVALLHGGEEEVWADAGYRGIEKWVDTGGRPVQWHVAMRPLLLRVRVPALLFLAGTTVGMAFLESERRFGVTISAQKVVPAAVALALLLVVADRFGIVAVAWIGLLSTVAGAVVVLMAARRLLGPLRPLAATRDPELVGVGRRWLHLSSSNAASFAGEWAFRVGASLLPVGLFSAVLYGRMVHDLMHAAVNDSAQTVALPRFAAAVARGGDAAHAPVAGETAERSAEADEGRDPDAVHRRLQPILRLALMGLAAISLPVTRFVGSTAPWSVALLFGRGRFLADGMFGPATVSLGLFSIGFFLQGLV